MAAAKVLIDAVADILADIARRAIDVGEVRAPRMIRLESPGHRPVHDAAGRVSRRVRVRSAPRGATTDEGSRRIDHLVNLPVDGLNRLALRDVIPTGPSPVE